MRGGFQGVLLLVLYSTHQACVTKKHPQLAYQLEAILVDVLWYCLQLSTYADWRYSHACYCASSLAWQTQSMACVEIFVVCRVCCMHPRSALRGKLTALASPSHSSMSKDHRTHSN